METLSNKEKAHLRGYAQALQDLMFAMTGDNTCAKRYDPIAFDEKHIYSYAFDFKNGTRVHPLAEFESIEEIKSFMVSEAKEYIEPL